MKATAFEVGNGVGDSLDSPSPEQMKAFLDALDPTDEEHGAAWLSTPEGYSLEWEVGGRLVFSRPDASTSHLPNVSREHALALWVALSGGRLIDVEREPWRAGNGYEPTPAKKAEIAAWRQRQDREFFDSLGSERSGVPCKRAACGRGAIEHSVLCRVHHFEMIKGRPCPFNTETGSSTLR